MKRIVTIFLLLIFSLTIQAQSVWTANHEKYQFAKKIPIRDLAGKSFRYEMAVSTGSSDTLSGLKFYGMAADKNDKLFNTRFLNIEKRIEQEWTIYTIVGQVPENAASIWFFTSVTATGTYYFDDISLFIQSYPGSWKQVNLDNPSFENKSSNKSSEVFSGYAVKNPKSGNPRTSLSEKVYKTGKYSLMITFSEAKVTSNLIAGE